VKAVTNRRILIQGPKLDSATLQQASRQLFDYSKEDGDILVVFDSPGGSLLDGKALYDAFRISRQRVIGLVQGAADSAAFTALQGCTIRLFTESSTMLIHDSVLAYTGRQKHSDNEAEYLKTFRRRRSDLRGERTWLMSLVMRKSGGGITRKQLSALLAVDRRLSAVEALEYGFIDGIV